jgi:hypothetical protein
MIIGDLNVVRAIVTPLKADSILIVNSYAVLPSTVSRELLQAQARNKKITQAPG